MKDGKIAFVKRVVIAVLKEWFLLSCVALLLSFDKHPKISSFVAGLVAGLVIFYSALNYYSQTDRRRRCEIWLKKYGVEEVDVKNE